MDSREYENLIDRIVKLVRYTFQDTEVDYYTFIKCKGELIEWLELELVSYSLLHTDYVSLRENLLELIELLCINYLEEN